MKYVEVIADAHSAETVAAIALKAKAQDFRLSVVGQDGMQQMRMLVDDDKLQLALDTLQNVLGAQPTARIIVLSVEACLPNIPKKEHEEETAATARESLYQEVEKGSRLDSNYVLLVMLATVVAAIGLIENNVAVVIGAMVIAPLLGPNLALSLATALGDVRLMLKSIKTLIFGIVIAITIAVIIGWLWSGELNSHELMSRTHANIDSIALALASGAAATLSLTTGLSGVLVGVMVAVALLPPAVTFGIMLGAGNIQLANEAGLLLLINIVCVNLASKLVFFFKGVRPRTWLEKEKAKQAIILFSVGWLLTLAVLVFFIFVRTPSLAM